MTAETQVRQPLAAVTLPMADWSHIVNAIDSSFQRKTKRGEHKKADEMKLIAMSMIRQLGLSMIQETEPWKK